jgi:hypothetical protein
LYYIPQLSSDSTKYASRSSLVMIAPKFSLGVFMSKDKVKYRGRQLSWADDLRLRFNAAAERALRASHATCLNKHKTYLYKDDTVNNSSKRAIIRDDVEG